MRGRTFRPFRLGLWLGLLAGLVWFVQRRRATGDEAVAGPAPAPRPAPRPVPPAPADSPIAPVVPLTRPEVVEVGEVDAPGEPEVATVEPAPEPEAAPKVEPAPEPEAAPKVEAAPVVEVGPTPEPAPSPAPEAVATPEPAEAPVAKKAAPVKKAPKKAKAAAKKGPSAKKRSPAKAGRQPAAWVAPDDAGVCPPSHPLKAKLASGLFHAPGGLAYARTKPDRCYRDEGAAEADGLRKAKR